MVFSLLRKCYKFGKGVSYNDACGVREELLEVDIQICACWMRVYTHMHTYSHSISNEHRECLSLISSNHPLIKGTRASGEIARCRTWLRVCKIGIEYLLLTKKCSGKNGDKSKTHGDYLEGAYTRKIQKNLSIEMNNSNRL